LEERESYTTEQAAEHAKKWCARHRGWQRICDIEDSDALYKNWDELSTKERAGWEEEYRSSAEAAWLEFGRKPCKVPSGFITGKGEFYKDVLQVPIWHNLMMVFQTSRLKAEEKIRCSTCKSHDHDSRRRHAGRYPHYCTHKEARGMSAVGIGRYIPAVQARTSPDWCPRKKEGTSL